MSKQTMKSNGRSIKNRKGERHGKLLCVKIARHDETGVYWECKCDCGATKIFSSTYLAGVIKSCGCANKDAWERAKLIAGGIRKHPVYSMYRGMKERCYNKKYKKYNDYGGRGIKVCDEWLNDSLAFLNWALANGYEKGLEIDRIDNDKDYCPDNCQLTTRHQNVINQRLIRKDNTTGYRGVAKTRSGNFAASVRFKFPDKKSEQFFLGTFPTIEEAAMARDKFCVAHNTGLPLNFPELKDTHNGKQ